MCLERIKKILKKLSWWRSQQGDKNRKCDKCCLVCEFYQMCREECEG